MAETDAAAGPQADLVPLARPGSRVVAAGTWSHLEGSALPEVPPVRKSVLDLASALRDRAGVPEQNMQRVLNPDTPLELGKAIAQSAAAATDSLVVYYAGHGLVGPDGGLYLATRSTGDLMEGLPYTALPFAAVRDAVMGSRAQTVAVILDCCFAARGSPPRGPVPLGPVFEQAALRGGYLLASTAREELGLARPGAKHTMFTGALIELLRDGEPTFPELLTFSHVYRYLVRVLPDAGAPRPHQEASDGADDLVLAPNVAYRRWVAGSSSSGTLDGSLLNGRGGNGHVCPYQGLRPFGPMDARYFFGRERLTEDLVDRIVSSRGMIAVVGASGCGKTSLLRAGMVPELAQRLGWDAAYMTPGPDPAADLDERVKALTAGERPAVLLVDQFERLFTGDVSESERQRFVTALAEAAGSGIPVVIAIRSDYYQACAQYPSLAQVLEDRQVLVTPMTAQELASAIEKPAEKAGLCLEDGLTRTLLNEARVRHHGEQSAVLPLLQYALLATWQQRDGSTLTLAGYDAAGRIEGAVKQAAEEAWKKMRAAGIAEEQIRAVMLRLVRLGEGAEDTRQRALVANLASGDELGVVRRMLDILAAARLVTIDADTAELAHDALLYAWPRLRGWIEEDRAALMAIQRMSDAARSWDQSGRKNEDLYRGTRLDTALQAAGLAPVALGIWPGARVRAWLKAKRTFRSPAGHSGRLARSRHTRDDQTENRQDPGPALNPLSPAFLVVSQHASRRRRAEPATACSPARADDSLGPQEQAFLGASTRAARRRALRSQIVLTAMAVLTAGLAVLAVVVIVQLRAAQSERDQAAGTALAAQSQATGDTDPVFARLEAAAAWQLEPNAESAYAMLSAAALPGNAVLKGTDGNSVFSEAFSPDSKTLAVGYYDGATGLWDVSTRRLVASLPDKSGGSAESVAFSPDGKLLAVGNYFGSTELWDVSSRRLVARLPGHTDGWPIYSVAFSPDGQFLAVGTANSTVQLWNVATLRLAKTLECGNGNNVESLAFSPDGRTIAVGTIQGTTQLWNVDTRRLAATLQPPSYDGMVYSVAFSPDGRILAVGTGSDPTRLWDVTTRRVAATLPSDGNTITSVAFSPDGETLALATGAGTTQLVDVPARQLIASLPDNDGNPLVSIAFSPDGKTLAAGTSGGSVQLSDVATVSASTSPLAILTAVSQEGMIDPAAFSPDGKTVALGTGLGTTQLWNVATRRRTFTLGRRLRNASVSAVAFSPDGKTLAMAVAADGTGSVELWDVAAHRLSATLPYLASSLAFSPDGKTLAIAAGADGTVELWDMTAHRLAATLRSGTGEQIVSVAISPDGKTLAMGTAYAGSQLWNMVTHRLIAKLPVGSFSQVSTVAFSPDSTTLAVAIDTGFTQLWDVAHPYQLKGSIFTGGDDYSAAFSPEGTVVAIATGRHVQLWDGVTEQQIGDLPYTIDQAGNPVVDAQQAVFNPESTLIAVSPNNGEVQLWSTPYLENTSAYLCTLAEQPFPHSEWAQLAPGVPYQEVCP